MSDKGVAIRIRIAITMNVYGLSNAVLTIHMLGQPDLNPNKFPSAEFISSK